MKKYFLTGLATLLPLAVTVYVIIFVIHLLTQPFIGVVTKLVDKLPIGSLGWITHDQLIRNLSQLLILISLLLFLFFFGMLARWFLFNTLIKIGDRILHRIPLFNTVYKTAKEIIHTLFSSGANSFQQVVLLHFPYQGCYCIGLVTSDSPKTCSEGLDQEMISVFIPTTPNPMTGFLLMSPRSHLIYLEMSTEDAIKYVVSCGVIQPSNKENQ